MSDGSGDARQSANGQQWTPPSDPTASSSSPYFAAPNASGPSPLGAATGGWTQPNRPGPVPLRPLGLGNILGGSFQTVRRNPRPTLGLAIGVLFVVFLLSMAIAGLVLWATFSRLENVATDNLDEVTAGTVLAGILSNLLPAVLSVIASALLQGIVVIEVARSVLGEKLTLRQLWARARGRLWALIGWMMMLLLAALIGIAVLTVLIIVFVSSLGMLGVALGVATGVFGGLAFIVVAVWLGTKLSVVPSAIMVERMRVRDAMRRSWQLTNGYFWRTFGIQALIAVILTTAVQIVSTPLVLLAPMLGIMLDPTGSNSTTLAVVMIGVSIAGLGLIVALSAVTMVVQSAANGLIYVDLRMRKEGLDLELARFVEERAVGVSATEDPYRVSGDTAQWSASSTSPWG